VYSLLAIEPIEAVIDRNTLSFLGGIIRNKSTIEFAILERELSMSKTNGNCYAIRVSKILQKFNLPILSVLINNPPTKLEWKSQVKRAVHIFWETTWQEEKTEKSTLKYLSVRYVKIGQLHYIWRSIDNIQHQVKQAEVKAIILTNTYTLQSNRAKYNQHMVNDTCQLCKTGTKDREHFILKCKSLEHVRQKYIQNLQDYLSSIQYGLYERIYRNDLLLHIILDSTSEDKSPSVIELKHQHYIDIEKITRSMCYYLHIRRTELLQEVQNSNYRYQSENQMITLKSIDR
jgi:hypothetical protein